MEDMRQMDVQTPFPQPFCGRCRWYDSIQDDCTVDQSVSLMVIHRDACPLWKEEKRQRKQSWAIAPAKHEERLALWGAGNNDYQIAKIVGCTPQAIRYWRKRNNLPRNYEVGRKGRGEMG